uniref:peptide chain release factor N(5)-glutamine methyltransferase n=1 Tax=Eubacterium cellulosolvens TaxID=29322 RepID=UPI000489E5EB|nr:peptide chain release factor N(5)-glutamine methyltransferase [[Eubacterium] cellulosolvens]
MREDSCSYRYWYHYGEELLAEAGNADAKSDAWLLLEYAAGITRSYYTLHMSDPMDDAAAESFQLYLKKRLEHIPVQQITGEAWFCGYSFYVTEDVLIPRQDTEVLIEEALRVLRPGMKILDMCTGSGCILLSLLKGRAVTGCAVDLSEAALSVARENSRRLEIGEDQVTFIHSDLFSGVDGEYDMIVTNPPYIPTDVCMELDPEVKDHEPMMALDGREDGLYFERKIAEDARAYLKKDAMIFMEIGYDQGEAMREILQSLGYEDVRIVRDLGGNDRVAIGRK